MGDLTDLRKRAAQQAQVGNYWAGKCLGLIDRSDRYAEALRHITAGVECETFTRPPYCRDPNSGRSRDSNYGATRWCDACIAHDALGVVTLEETG